MAECCLSRHVPIQAFTTQKQPHLFQLFAPDNSHYWHNHKRSCPIKTVFEMISATVCTGRTATVSGNTSGTFAQDSGLFRHRSSCSPLTMVLCMLNFTFRFGQHKGCKPFSLFFFFWGSIMHYNWEYKSIIAQGNIFIPYDKSISWESLWEAAASVMRPCAMKPHKAVWIYFHNINNTCKRQVCVYVWK